MKAQMITTSFSSFSSSAMTHLLPVHSRLAAQFTKLNLVRCSQRVIVSAFTKIATMISIAKTRPTIVSEPGDSLLIYPPSLELDSAE
mmetsp:Transcript_6858/g.14873  ORF Transcript_6858/g.14873 Transcript_6858/m.14873 type:complete len:87 (-) Transcript_6858:226-486(-)